MDKFLSSIWGIIMNYFKEKCLVLEWFYQWIDQDQSYENAFSKVIYDLDNQDEIDNIIYPIVMAQRIARNYKPISNQTISCIKKAINEFDSISKSKFNFSAEDYNAFASDVDEAKLLIDYLNNKSNI